MVQYRYMDVPILQSFLPELVVSELADQPGRSPIEYERRFHAATLFADISGFTAISEALGKAGRAGTDELASLLNNYFEPLIECIHAHGGSIVKFGGDAMTVLFPYPPADRPNKREILRRAAACALALQARQQEHARAVTRAGTFELSMKIGLAAGAILARTVGKLGQRLEYVAAGSALDRCVAAQGCSRRGGVAVHHEPLAALAPDEYLALEPEGEVFQLQALKIEVRLPPAREVSSLPPQAQLLAVDYLHPRIAGLLQSGQLNFINEHRLVSVLFVGFSGLDYDADRQAGARLQAFVEQVVAVTARYDGYLNKVDMGDKGSKAVILFGAPVAHEDDSARALRCALELRDLPGLTLRMGMKTGFVYAGQVGSDARREYTVIGDSVNTAARLMAAAEPGQILVSQITRRMESERFTWEADQHLQLKGKSELVEAHVLVGIKGQERRGLQELRYDLPLVGRQAELEEARGLLDQSLQGRGQILGLTAEAGLGKSRLAGEIAHLADERGFQVYGGWCLSHGSATPYLPWRSLLRGVLEVADTLALEDQIQVLANRLAASDASLVARLPLLGVALNLPIPDNGLTRAMEARLRKESLEALACACLRERAREGPIMLALEDCHWIDPLSADLLLAVGRALAEAPVMLLAVYRPPSGAQPTGTPAGLERFPNFTEMRLDELDPQAAAELINTRLLKEGVASQDLPAGLVERILDRAQGNPFFIEEILHLIKERGLERSDPEMVELPTSLHSLIAGRLDGLPEGERSTLKVASVIGRTFRASWLWSIYPALGSPAEVVGQLHHLSRLDITPLERDEPEAEYIFKHIITREVAYASLSNATRRMLHEATAHFIEETYTSQLDGFVDWLAYHYGESDNRAKQREYFRRAGKAAQAAFANQAALAYFQRLLPLVEGVEKIEALLCLNEVLLLTGEWSQAQSVIQQALELAEASGDQSGAAFAQRAAGELLRRRGEFANALELLSRSLQAFVQLGERLSACEVRRELGIVHWSQGDYPHALACFEFCCREAVELGEPASLCRATGNLGGVYWSQGNTDQALEYFERSRQMAAALGDRLFESKMAGNIGTVYLDRGDYSLAFQAFNRTLQAARELGYRQGISIAIGNLGAVYLESGVFESAQALYQQNLQLSLEMGDQLGVGIALWNLGAACLEQGQYKLAEVLLERAARLGRALDSPYELCETLYTQAELLAASGRLREAQAACAEAVALADGVERADIQFKTALQRLRLAGSAGQMKAIEQYQALEALRPAWPGEEQQAALDYELASIESADPNLERAVALARQRAAESYRRLAERTPRYQYRRRYEALISARLPEPIPLPPLPDGAAGQPLNLQDILSRVDEIR